MEIELFGDRADDADIPAAVHDAGEEEVAQDCKLAAVAQGDPDGEVNFRAGIGRE